MTISIELLLAYIVTAAAVLSAVLGLFRWADSQDRAKHDQLRREIRNEVLAEIYSRLLELNVSWLSSNPQQRETLETLSASLSDDMNANDNRD